MTVKERYSRAIEWFEQTMPTPRTELHYDTPFHLLVAVILSAQCTDKRVNIVTPALFERFPDAASLAAATEEEVFGLISSISYPNNKTAHLIGMARRLIDEFDGEVPGDIDSLVSLPGVGRKTANVILSVVFNRSAMAVDTHVFRVSHRIGLVSDRCTTPLAVEKALMKNLDPELVPRAHHWLILHGRYICKARRPDCLNCGLTAVCRHYNKATKAPQK
ncbi:MAG: endonuclease III [Paramuribaculum sp.]|nr:endonuclease III [Paramuribaculum sp.]MDE7450311.1 endonuclease III [Paramuribaculum sp.]